MHRMRFVTPLAGFAVLALAAPRAVTAQDTSTIRRMIQPVRCPTRNFAALKRIPTAALSTTQLLERVARIAERARTAETKAAMHKLDSVLARIEAPKRDSARQVAARLDAFGVTLWMQSRDNAAVYVLTRAVTIAPDDYLHWNNLGAALHRVDDDESAVPLLLHASRLAPASALPWSNLGTAYQTLGDPVTATTDFVKATQLLRFSVEANLGLGRLAVCRRDYRRAIEYYMLARRGGFTTRGEEEVDEANEDDTPLPPMPVPAAELPAPQMYIRPAMPELRANAAKIATSDVVSQRADRLLKSSAQWGMESLKLAADIRQQGEPASASADVTLYRSSDEGVAELKRVHAWYGAKADTLAEAYGTALAEIVEKDMEGVQRIQEWQRKLPVCETEYCRARQEAERCQRMRMLRDNGYTRAQKALTAMFDGLLPLLTEWDQVSGYWVERIEDPARQESEDLMRRSAIGAVYGAAWTNAAALLRMAPLEDCEPVPPEPAGEDPGDPKARRGHRRCPLGEGVTVDMFVLSAKLDCKEISVKGGEGIVGELKWNYKDKTGTMYVGVGASLQAGVGPVTAGPSADTGFFVTFDRHGQFTDVGVGSSASFGLNAGPGWGTGVDYRVGIVSGMQM